jgi:hypothetical protein
MDSMIELSNAGKTINGAVFSHCGNYRYVLWRIWDRSKPAVAFIGLNPSTANATTDDPTIRRVVAIAKNLGYGGVHMLNLFAIVSSDPAVLKTCPDPVAMNDVALKTLCTGDIIFAWGSFKEAQERSKVVMQMFPNAKALHINKDGTPKHPLYCPTKSIPIPFIYNQPQIKNP